MNEERMMQILSEYNVQIRRREATEEAIDDGGGAVLFFDVSSSDSSLELTVQLINNEVYCIYCLDNQFFDLKDADFEACLRDILNGDYAVEGEPGSQSIVTHGGLHPERIEDGGNFTEAYAVLPTPWPRK